MLTYLCDTGYRISHDSRFCAFDFSQLNPSAPPLPQSKHFPLDITPTLPLLFSTSALPQFTFSRQQDVFLARPRRKSALPQFTFSRQQDRGLRAGLGEELCHSSHSRVSKTSKPRFAVSACFATVHILASARRNETLIRPLSCFATVHILASARPNAALQAASICFATVHILASARPKTNR